MSHPSAKKQQISSRRKKSRPLSSSQAELVTGINSVLEGLRHCPGAVQEIMIEKGCSSKRLQQLTDLARANAIPVKEIPDRPGKRERDLDRLTEGGRSQGVAALVRLPILNLDQLLDIVHDFDGIPMLLALDSIQDPHNLGAIIRSAAAAGVTGIILPKDRTAPVTGTVIRISAGGIYQLDICRVTNLVSALKLLKKSGLWIFGTAKDKAQPIYDADLTVPACIVIGSEGKGLRPLVAEQCDLQITIPMQGPLDSLNASVAAGIILFEAVRQRRGLPA